MRECKHFHAPGVLHEPCKDCLIEQQAARIAEAKQLLSDIRADLVARAEIDLYDGGTVLNISNGLLLRIDALGMPENAPSNNEASSGTSALDDGLERIYKDSMHDMQVIKTRLTELQGGVEPDLWQFVPSVLSVALWKAAMYEREACANLCATMFTPGQRPEARQAALRCAESIRERSNAELTGDEAGRPKASG